ncbi:MAG: hypothetical protein CO162_03640 [bacterium (Candidatus Ratteibacteria) CG_4_9_14_3_um_filter_41_21]|uniref:Glycosyltransferase RgtA/B/C/D-like domain-containing protein n=1 Tax=bacterium (Candidatus Ratteibacteria) CG_4_9_14_3_um_filter_41_21 TaxID=2014289 RepID=A0A2M7YG41_9BACT|nr:MAG: hypothetical protein CO162_03640 [bacterium (Candidatus Ratteibacteria) CG_4_9_14_3_um_filter_41_21]
MAKDRILFYTFLFFLIGYCCYILYPLWYLPVSNRLKIVELNLLLFGIFGLSSFFYLLIPEDKEKGDVKAPLFCLDKKCRIYLLTITIVCLILHLFQINYPILTGLDSHFHTGLPALILYKLNKATLKLTNGSLSFSFFIWLLIVFTSLFFSLFRKILFRLKRVNIFICLFFMILLSNIYGLFLIKTGILESLGKISLLHRYPPLGKTFFFFGYCLFGIHEWVGRLIEIFFTIFGGLFLVKIISLYRKEPMMLLSAYTLYIFLPPLFNVIWLNHLEAGTLFFLLAGCYYFLRYQKAHTSKDFALTILIFSCGIMYKRLVILSIFMILTYLFLEQLLSKKKGNIKKGMKIVAIPFLFSLPWIFFYPAFWPSPGTITIDAAFSPLKIWMNISSWQFALGKPIISLFILSLFYYLLRAKELQIRFFLILSFLYYALVAAIGFGYTRTSLLFFPVIILAIDGFLYNISEKFKNLSKVIFGGLCTLILLSFIYNGLLNKERHLVTLSNSRYYLLPYDKAIKYIKDYLPDRKIYAPMICEPSHFYLAKYGIGEIVYERRIWANSESQTLDSLYKFCQKKSFYYLLFPKPEPFYNSAYQSFFNKYKDFGLPYSGYIGGDWFLGRIKDKIIIKLFEGEDSRFKMIKKFKRGNCELAIFEVSI